MSESGSKDISRPIWKFGHFLTHAPLNSEHVVSDFLDWRGRYPEGPTIRTFCHGNRCRGERTFTTRWNNIDEESHGFLTCTCRDCQEYKKTFAIIGWSDSDSNIVVTKIGIYPLEAEPVSPYLRKILGSSFELFLTGVRSEESGYGIGAFTYYRRVIEDRQSELFKRLMKIAEAVESDQREVDALRDASHQASFSDAIKAAGSHLPQALRYQGRNPMTVIYDVLSRGIHGKDDRECLSLAHNIRIALLDLSERMDQVTTQRNAANRALTELQASLNPKPASKTDAETGAGNENRTHRARRSGSATRSD